MSTWIIGLSDSKSKPPAGDSNAPSSGVLGARGYRSNQRGDISTATSVRDPRTLTLANSSRSGPSTAPGAPGVARTLVAGSPVDEETWPVPLRTLRGRGRDEPGRSPWQVITGKQGEGPFEWPRAPRSLMSPRSPWRDLGGTRGPVSMARTPPPLRPARGGHR